MIEFIKTYSQLIRNYRSDHEIFKQYYDKLNYYYLQTFNKNIPQGCKSCHVDRFFEIINSYEINLKNIDNTKIMNRIFIKQEVGLKWSNKLNRHFTHESILNETEIDILKSEFGEHCFSDYNSKIVPLQVDNKPIEQIEVNNEFEKMTIKELKDFAKSNKIDLSNVKNNKKAIADYLKLL